MSKPPDPTPHPDAWLWEQLERILPKDVLQILREGYQAVFRAYALNLTYEHYTGPMPEVVKESIEQQLGQVKLPQTTELLEKINAVEDVADGQLSISSEGGDEPEATLLAVAPTRCGICKRVSNHDEDWLCYRDRDAVEQVLVALREGGPRKALVPIAKAMIAAAYNYIQLVDDLDELWDDMLRVKQFRAKRDHTTLMKLVSRSGRPSEPMYDEMHRLTEELGYTKKRAIEKVRATFPEAANLPDKHFLDALWYRKQSR